LANIRTDAARILYKLEPTAVQDQALNRYLNVTRNLYNAALEQRITVYHRRNGTSQECSGCGVPVPKALRERWHSCPDCGLSIHRGHNAGINIGQRAWAVPFAEAVSGSCASIEQSPMSEKLSGSIPCRVSRCY